MWIRNRYTLKPIPAIALFMVTLISGMCLAQRVEGTEFKKHLHFAHGTNRATVSGDIVRGDQDIYFINVHSGQVMSIKISSLENNAVFEVLEPRVRGRKEEKDITGGADITKWSGRLAKTGEYKIEVGGTRGNTSYTLQVSVK